MAQLDSSGDVLSSATVRLRLYVQGQIQAAIDDISQEDRWKYRQKTFGVALAAPITGTMSFTKGEFTATVSGQTPANSWLGCHFVVSGNGFPLRVQSFSGQVVTFNQAIMATTSASLAFTLYFSSALMPLDCRIVQERSVTLQGHGTLVYQTQQEMEQRMGYYGGIVGDYGFPSNTLYSRTVQTPDIGEPIYYASWDYATVSNKLRKLFTVYPFPDVLYAVNWRGWRKPTELQITGTATGDSDEPDLPEDFHRSLLVPRVKLRMCGYPGFELSSGEKQGVAQEYADSLRKFYSEVKDDQTANRPWTPTSMSL